MDGMSCQQARQVSSSIQARPREQPAPDDQRAARVSFVPCIALSCMYRPTHQTPACFGDGRGGLGGFESCPDLKSRRYCICAGQLGERVADSEGC